MFGFIIAYCLLLQDSRIALLPACLMSGIWTVLTDAMPTGLRRIATICGLGFAILLLLSFQLGLYFQWIHINEVFYQVGNITLTGSGIAANCTTNVLIFVTRNVLTAFWYPNILTVIKSPVKSEKVSKIEARVLHAAFHLKEATKYLQEDKSRGT